MVHVYTKMSGYKCRSLRPCSNVVHASFMIREMGVRDSPTCTKFSSKFSNAMEHTSSLHKSKNNHEYERPLLHLAGNRSKVNIHSWIGKKKIGYLLTFSCDNLVIRNSTFHPTHHLERQILND